MTSTAKALLLCFKANGSPAGSIPCQFNPKQLKLDKKNNWKPQETPGINAPNLDFGGGAGLTFTVDLFFDTTDTQSDVRGYTDKLLDVMMVKEDNNVSSGQTDKLEPYRVRFQWGSIMSIEAVINSVSLTFTMFSPSGIPLRATANVTFQQARDDKKFWAQNPTSQSAARKMHVVVEGETLSWIAYQEYGDPSHWRHIAQTNGLANPQALYPGQVLNLVPLS